MGSNGAVIVSHLSLPLLSLCRLLVTFNSSSPQSPTLADYGITKETLDRLALLKVKDEPQLSCTTVPQWLVFMSAFELAC